MEQMNLFGTIEEDNIFVAVDVETTGLSPILNELIEISAIKYNKTNKIDVFTTLIRPKNEIPNKITQITGISNEMVKNAPSVEKIMPMLVSFIGNNPMIAHNASFDMGFLQNNSNKSFSDNEIIDTLLISRQMAPELSNHKLGTMARYIGIVENGFHRAEFDCECCAKIYMKYKGWI